MSDPIIRLETERFYLRDFTKDDLDDIFELDSDPKVHRYLGNNPVQSKAQIHQIIDDVLKQYELNGIGRWAIIDKSSGEHLGWSGLKIEAIKTNGFVNYPDLGYRLKSKHWGKGIATETAIACAKYAFDELNWEMLYGAADVANIASNIVLQKAGLKFVNEFKYDGELCNWYAAKNPGL